MTQSIIEPPNGAGAVPAVRDAAAPAATRSVAPGEALIQHRRRAAAEQSFPAAVVVAACVAVHLLAAALIYRDMARDLYAIFDAAPRLLVLERGLTRLTAASVFLPPIIPATLVAVVALWLGGARRTGEVARWLALALVPLAVDGVFRAVGVLIAPPSANVGDLLDLPTRFSPGPRLLLDLAGIHPGRGLAYWAVVATAAAAVSAWCVARALLSAERAAHASTGRRRRRGRSAVETLQVAVAVVGTWIALGFAGQVALPWATQLFLKVFG